MDDDYDDFYNEHYGGVDETTFQMYGYGGFGYDTSGVKSNEKESIVVTAARQGHLRAIQQVLTKEKTNNTTKYRALLNGARRWTEVDYRMSGFTNEYEWFDLTPLATAALAGHADIVEYLLKEGADPTLDGCPDDNVYYTAYRAADEKLKRAFDTIEQILSYKGEQYLPYSLQSYLVLKEKCSEEHARELLETQQSARLCLDMLVASKKFWNQARYSNARYSKSRETSGYSNRPTDMNGLVEAVNEVKERHESKQPLSESARYAGLPQKIEVIRAKIAVERKKHGRN